MRDRLISGINEIYDCVDGDFNHARAAKAISQAADDTGFLFSYTWPFLGGVNSLTSHNIPEGAIKALSEGDIDLQMHGMFEKIKLFPELVPVLRHAYVPDEEHFKTRIYQEAAAPWGLHSEGVSILKKTSQSDGISCWFIRHPEQKEVDAEILAKIAILNKHLVRAMGLQDRIDHLEAALINSSNAMDLLDFGLILYSQNTTQAFINSAAKRIILQNDGMLQNRDGFEFSDSTASAEFYANLSMLFSPKTPLNARTGGFIKAHRPSGKPPLSIMLVPMVERKGLDLHSISVAVMIFDPLNRPATSGQILQNAYGLTQAETALALALMQGCDVQDYADERGVSINTVRSQLRALFAKTDTTRQGELISLLLRSCTGVISGR